MMKQQKRFTLPDYLAAGIIIGYFLLGIFITPDYGTNWDDLVQRERVGMSNWDFITHTGSYNLIHGNDKYHGPAFEILLIAVEKTLHLTETRDILLARHYAVFVFFTSVLIVFFLFCRRLFEDSRMGLLGLAMLLLCPRIFAESFYNPKDIVFLGAMIWSLYALLLFSERPTFSRALFLAFSCAFATDIRLIGILMMPIALLQLSVNLYQTKLSAKDSWTKILLFILLFSGLMIAMWPILQTGPARHLLLAFRQLSNFKVWTGHTLYLGSRYPGTDTPWHYHWIWLLVSLPEVYLLLFAAGVFIFVGKMISGRSVGLTKTSFLLISLFFFFFPLVFRSLSRSVVYDAWRHIYFVYPFMLILAVYAVSEILLLKKNILRLCLMALVILGLCDSLISMVRMHPYEYVYFNHTANALLRPIDQQLELDYWGLSYKQGIVYVLSQTKDRGRLNIAFANDPGYYNLDFIPAAQRMHFHPVDDRDSAQFFLTNYRDLHTPSPPGEAWHTLRAQGNIVLGIYKLR